MNEKEICRKISEILGIDYDCSKDIDELLKILEYEINEYKKSLEEQTIFMEAQLEELSRSYEEISTLLEISEIFGGFEFPMNLREKLEKVIPLLKKVVRFKDYIVRVEDINIGNLSYEEVEQEIENREKTVLIEPGESQRFSNLLFVPIIGNRYYGYMCFSGKEEGIVFTASDRRITELTSRYIANALDRMEFLQKEIERQRLEEQMEIARRIQSELLPRELPRTRFIDIAACSYPAIQVGGDYYDVFAGDGKVLAVMGDVAGKSVPAALLMSAVRSYLRVLNTLYSDLEKLVNHLNSILCEDLSNDRFVTMVFLEIFQNGTLNLVNAGHNPVYFLRNGEMVKLEATAIPIGISEWNYRKHTIQLEPNTFIVVYTDGVTEARNILNEEYGYERLEKTLREYAGDSTEELLFSLTKDVEEFSKGVPQHDDMTIMVLKYKGQQEVE
ncbi:PP2C family protein-serine/threonine phosphatase [Thermotoga sp. SG1]|uniref:PP2C family protein-serine/threonine phosphatase n=1 Tax=Thermotoga sp. SG1 TaxID=126739 RepID=UPI000C776D0E|nr:PP2C family protein-serine/threonine phosphatase [Thermotoga sp. SG1]PLV56604.1 hypothetical protein AS006_03065 [Thermotoga sp. SG1]